MSTHPPENPRIEARPATPAVEKRTGLTFRRYFTKQGRHPYDELAWETRSAVINDERGQAGVRAARHRGPDDLEPDGDQHRRFEVLPRTARVPGAREQRAPAHRAGGRHHLRLGRRAGLLRDRRGPPQLLGRADAPAGPAEGRVQQPGLVQRRHREAPAGVGVLHQRGQRHDGLDPGPGQDRGHAVQVRLGHGLEPVGHPLLEGAAGRRRHRVGAGLVHARLRRLRGRHQERRQDPARGQDGDPERGPSRHRGVRGHQGGGGEEGLGPHRRRVRRLLQRAGRRVRLRLLPEREPLGARDRRVHARGGRGQGLADALRADGPDQRDA